MIEILGHALLIAYVILAWAMVGFVVWVGPQTRKIK